MLANGHAMMEVPTHRHALQLHVDLPQQVISRHLLVKIIQQPRFTQTFVGKSLGLLVLALGQEDPTHKFIHAQLQSSLKQVVAGMVPVVIALERRIEVIERERITAIFVETISRKSKGPINQSRRPNQLDYLVQLTYFRFDTVIRKQLFIHFL
jgi:hypothetical protein